MHAAAGALQRRGARRAARATTRGSRCRSSTSGRSRAPGRWRSRWSGGSPRCPAADRATPSSWRCRSAIRRASAIAADEAPAWPAGAAAVGSGARAAAADARCTARARRRRAAKRRSRRSPAAPARAAAGGRLHRVPRHAAARARAARAARARAARRPDARRARRGARRVRARPRALLLATDAAAEGLNLHHRCRLVINLELPWNPMRLEQRIGRVDRIGQRRTVHAFHLVADGTGEDAAARAAARARRRRRRPTSARRIRSGDERAVARARHRRERSTMTMTTVDLRAEAVERSRAGWRGRARCVRDGDERALAQLEGDAAVDRAGAADAAEASARPARVPRSGASRSRTRRAALVESRLVPVLVELRTGAPTRRGAPGSDRCCGRPTAASARASTPTCADVAGGGRARRGGVRGGARCARERAIAGARLASAGAASQPGLFDRRAERVAQAHGCGGRRVRRRRPSSGCARSTADGAIVAAPARLLLVLVP